MIARNTKNSRIAKNSKNEKRIIKNEKKIQKCPKSHICPQHQKTEVNPEGTKLEMKLKKVRKSQKNTKT